LTGKKKKGAGGEGSGLGKKVFEERRKNHVHFQKEEEGIRPQGGKGGERRRKKIAKKGGCGTREIATKLVEGIVEKVFNVTQILEEGQKGSSPQKGELFGVQPRTEEWADRRRPSTPFKPQKVGEKKGKVEQNRDPEIKRAVSGLLGEIARKRRREEEGKDAERDVRGKRSLLAVTGSQDPLLQDR